MITLTTTQAWLIGLNILLIIIANPLGDAIRDMGLKEMQKNIEIARDLLFLFTIHLFVQEWGTLILLGFIYLAFRLALHNMVYNIVRKLPWHYTGTTSLSDRLEVKIQNSIGVIPVMISRILVFAWGCLCIYLLSI